MRSARWPSAASCSGAAPEAVGEPFAHSIRVRFAECDLQGVVFNAHYLAYIDVAITELWRAALGSYQTMLDRGVDIVVADAHLRFHAGARFDQELTLELAITHMGNASIVTRHRIAHLDCALVDATMVHVTVDRKTLSKTPIPDWLRAGLTPWLVEET
jgi:acyl-CoA thioester hydrolase